VGNPAESRADPRCHQRRGSTDPPPGPARPAFLRFQRRIRAVSGGCL